MTLPRDRPTRSCWRSSTRGHDGPAAPGAPRARTCKPRVIPYPVDPHAGEESTSGGEAQPTLVCARLDLQRQRRKSPWYRHLKGYLESLGILEICLERGVHQDAPGGVLTTVIHNHIDDLCIAHAEKQHLDG